MFFLKGIARHESGVQEGRLYAQRSYSRICAQRNWAQGSLALGPSVYRNGCAPSLWRNDLRRVNFVGGNISPFKIPSSCYHTNRTLKARQELFDIIDDISESESESEQVSEKKKKETNFVNFREWDIELVTKIIKELKGTDVVVIDTLSKCNWVNYMVFVTGRSGAHLQAMANALMYELKIRKRGTHSIDHKDCDYWIIVNSGDILINLFTEEYREEYDIERTWVLRREPGFVYREEEDVMKELKFVYDEEDGVYEEVFESAKDSENYTGKGGNKQKPKKIYKDREPRGNKKKIVLINNRINISSTKSNNSNTDDKEEENEDIEK